MLGSEIELKWNRKDLQSLEAVLPRVKQRHVAVQAGGCLGVFAKRLAKDFTAVYTFEPDPQLFALMCINVPEPNVIKMQAALGSDKGMVHTVCELRPNDGKTVLHEGMTRTEPGGIIPVLRINDLTLPHCDLIYLDVEGDELYALHGARETIEKHRPVVVCEVNRGIEYRGFRQKDVENYMRLLGYEAIDQLRSDTVFISKSS